jgi:hypothetical protein
MSPSSAGTKPALRQLQQAPARSRRPGPPGCGRRVPPPRAGGGQAVTRVMVRDHDLDHDPGAAGA